MIIQLQERKAFVLESQAGYAPIRATRNSIGVSWTFDGLYAFVYMSVETLTVETPEHVELQLRSPRSETVFSPTAIDHFLQLPLHSARFCDQEYYHYGVRDLGHKAADIIEEEDSGFSRPQRSSPSSSTSATSRFSRSGGMGRRRANDGSACASIQEDGRPVGFFATLTRNLIRGADFVPMILFLPFYSIGIVSVFTSPQSERLGDYAAGTVVIKERAFESPSFDEVFEHEVVDTALRREASPVDFRGDVRLVDAAEIGVIETFMRRRHDLPPGPRQWLAERLATPVLERIRPYYNPDGFSYEGFLEELLARHRASARDRG
jgi:hypothetical protein